MKNLTEYLLGESSDSGPACFWSYVRDDDERMLGKLGEVSQGIADFYQIETGNPLQIMRDVDDIRWGQSWEERVSDGLQNVMFLIAAITPNYLKSTACRAEMTRFRNICSARGVKDLVLPIVFSGRHLIREDSDDEIAQFIAKTQYVPFDDAWFTDRRGEPFLQGVRKMALSIIAIEAAAESQLNRALAAEASHSFDAPSNGQKPKPRRQPIDMNTIETSSPEDDPQLSELVEILERELIELTPLIVTAGSTFQTVADRLAYWGNEHGKPATAKAANQYFFKIASDLDAPAKLFHRESAEAYNKAISADTTIQRLRQIAGEMADNTVAEALNASFASGFGDSMAGIQNTVTQLDLLAPKIADAERLSSLMKRSLRPVRIGMQIVRDLATMLIEWNTLSGTITPLKAGSPLES